MHNPTFSILVPTYNQAEFLTKALDSLLAQTDSDWEAVVVNDGSTDQTRAVLDEYAAKDNRIRAFHTENGGTGAALNKALRESCGQWICWLSSDDLFEPDKLALHRQWFDICPDARFFYTYFRLLYESSGQCDERHDLWGPLPDRRHQTLGLFRRNFISGITICVHRAVFAELGGFDASLRYGQDYDRWLWITSRYPGVFIPEWTAINRNHAGQGSEVFPQACYYDTAKAAIRFLGTNSLEQVVPLADTTRFDEALGVLTAALDVAKDSDAFLYWLGVHPALLFNIYAWIAEYRPRLCAEGLWNRLETVAVTQMLQHSGEFGALWRGAYMVARLRPNLVRRDGITPEAVAHGHYHALRARRPEQVEALERYTREYMNGCVPVPVEPNLYGQEIAVTAPFDASAEVRNSLWQVAELLANSGASVVFMEQGEAGVDFQNGVLRFSVPSGEIFEHVSIGLRPFNLTIVWEQCPGLSGARVLQIARLSGQPGVARIPTVFDPKHPDAEGFLSFCARMITADAPEKSSLGLISNANTVTNKLRRVFRAIWCN